MALPDPSEARPIRLPDGTRRDDTVFLRAVIDHPNIEVGAYTYAHDATRPADFAARLAPYLFPGAPERLVIGKFCQIAEGVRFLTASAEHARDALSSFPFAAFDPDRIAAAQAAALPRDMIIGHDCWLGRGATLTAGARLGNGVVVGAGAVVSRPIPDYAVVAGNPAEIRRRRFGAEDVAELNRLAWWRWSAEHVADAVPLLEGGDVAALAAFAAARGLA